MRLTHFNTRTGAFTFVPFAVLVAIPAIAVAACSSSSSAPVSSENPDGGPGVSVGGCPGVVCAADSMKTTCQCISGSRSNLTGSNLTVPVSDCAEALVQPVCCEDPDNDLCYCFSNSPCETGEVSVANCTNALVGNPTAPDSTPPSSCSLQN